MGRAEEGNDQREIRRHGDLGRPDDELDLAAQIREPARRRVEHDAIGEDDPGLEAIADHLDLGDQRIVALVVGQQDLGVEGLDAAEQGLAASLAGQLEVLGLGEEITGDQRRPALDPALAGERPEQIEPGQKELPVVAIEVVVDEDNLLLSRGQNLPLDVAQVGYRIASAFRGQRAEAAAEVAVAARLGVAQNTPPFQQVVAGKDLVGDIGRAEGVTGNRLELLDVAHADVVERSAGNAPASPARPGRRPRPRHGDSGCGHRPSGAASGRTPWSGR